MSTQDPNDPTGAGEPGRQPSEEELMAAYEEQMRNIRVEEILVQSLASIIEVGGRRAGLAGSAEEAGAPDPNQLALAIEAIRALQPLAAPLLGPNASQVDQALSQLQLAYAKLTGTEPGPQGGGAAGGPGSGPGGQGPGGAGPGGQPGQGGQGGAGGGRLWVPGQ